MTIPRRVRIRGQAGARLLTVLLGLLLAGCGGAPSAMAPEAPMAASYAPQPGPAGAAAPGEPSPASVAQAPSPVGAAGPGGQAYAPGAERAQAEEASSRPAGGASESGAGKLGKGSPEAGKPPRAAKQADVEAPKQAEPSIVQMLIYTAELRLMLAEEAFSATIDRVADLAVGMGGYLAAHDNASVQIRVPSVRFREALKQIEKLGVVTNRSVQVQDVSEEYNDLGIRLKSLKATRDRLEQFLARAKDIQEVLNVERELGRVNAEVDRIEGRMRFLASRAAYSTITVRLEPKPKGVVVVDPNREPPPPPPPRTLVLPIQWLKAVGLDRLLQLD
jgi:hypothetical protein